MFSTCLINKDLPNKGQAKGPIRLLPYSAARVAAAWAAFCRLPSSSRRGEDAERPVRSERSC